MKFEQAMNSASNPDIVGKFQQAKNFVKEKKEWVGDKYNEASETVKALKVDLNDASKDEKFTNFLKDTNQNYDWKIDKQDVRKSYVVYKRSQKIKEEMGNLFAKKYESFNSDKERISDDIAKEIIRLVKENPQELKRIEKSINSCAAEHERTKVYQDIIDKHDYAGGKEGLNDKLETLEKAKSFKKVIYKLIPSLGIGKDNALAYENANRQYGIEDKEDIKKEIKNLKESLKTIKGAEKKKSVIQDKFAKKRSKVMYENSIAKFVHSEMEHAINYQFGKVDQIGPVRSVDYGDSLAAVDKYKQEFGLNSDAGKRKFSKLFKKSKANPENNAHNFSEKEVDELRNILVEEMGKAISTEVLVIIQSKEKTELEQQLDNYIKKAEFAGMTKKQSVKKVYESFVKISSELRAMDSGMEEVLQILTKVMTANEYLTK